MTEQHTPGKAYRDGSNAIHTNTPDGPYQLALVSNEETALRLVACWNFCVDMETKTMESMNTTAYKMLMEKAAERDELLAALKALYGPSDDPAIGWRGTGGTEVLFACEYCGERHEDCTLIDHKTGCPVLAARAAIRSMGK